MPAWKPFSPGTCPPHNMTRRRGFPEGKVLTVSFFFLIVQVARRFQKFIQFPAAELSIRKLLSVLFYIKINRTIYSISVTIFYDFLDHIDLFHDMPRCCGFNTWIQVVKLMHRPME